MKTTGYLKVKGDFSQRQNTVIMHPNDGFDLGFMKQHYPVKLFKNESTDPKKIAFPEKGQSGYVFLDNDCTHGSIYLNKKFWELIGQPRRIKLVYKGENLYLLPEQAAG